MNNRYFFRYITMIAVSVLIALALGGIAVAKTGKSDAAKTGIIADYQMPGVVFCRTGIYNATYALNSAAGNNTIQMIPVPKGARILDIAIYNGAMDDATVMFSVGDGGDTDRFRASYNGSVAFQGRLSEQNSTVSSTYYQYSAADTVDITIDSGVYNATDSGGVIMDIWYKITNILQDENEQNY